MRHDTDETIERLNSKLHRMRRTVARKGGFKSIRQALRCADRQVAVLSRREG